MCHPEGAEPRSCSRRDRDEGSVPGVCPRYRPPLLCRQTGPATMITGCSGFLGPHKQPPEAQSIADLCQPDSGLQSSCGSAGFASAGSGEHALPSTACTWAGFSPGSWGLFPGHPTQPSSSALLEPVLLPLQTLTAGPLTSWRGLVAELRPTCQPSSSSDNPTTGQNPSSFWSWGPRKGAVLGVVGTVWEF